MSSPSDPNDLDDLLARFLSEHSEPSQSDLEGWLEQRAEVSAEVGKTVVTAFLARRDSLDPNTDKAQATPTIGQRLADRFGPGVDPEIALDQEGPDESGVGDVASAQILSRLSGRGPASQRYRFKGKVGKGGMGAVLRVWDEDLRRNLAMKVILGKTAVHETGETPAVESRQLSRFLEEAQITGQLSHPGIVPVHDLGLDDEGRVYFTMKLVKGQTLREVFEELHEGRGGWTRERVLGLLLKVCESLSYAHDKGVVHRDLKPDNVMVGKYGEVYVMDWGLARVASRDDQHDLRMHQPSAATISDVRTECREQADADSHSPVYTMDGDIVGTPAYMPPEQSLGQVDDIGPHSDVYAIGAMLYQLLAGRMPYETPGSSASAYMVLRWAREGPPKPLQKLVSNVPAELTAICDRAMEREIERRYADVTALRDDLQAFLEDRVVSAFETGAWAEARKWAHRNRGFAASLGATFLILVVGVIVSYSFYRRAAGNAVEARRQTDIAEASAERAIEQEGIAKASEASAIEQERIAEAKEARALREEEIANSQRAEARRQREIAEAQKAWFDRLSVVVKLKEAAAAAADFEPAWPDKIAPMERWLKERAEPLVADLPLVRKTIRELEASALEQSEEEKRADRESHVPYLELEKKVAALQRAMNVRNQVIDAPQPELPPDAPTDRVSLITLAQARAGVPRRVWGEEALGLAYAKQAIEVGGRDHHRLNVLARCYWANGMDDEARAALQAAIDVAPENKKPTYRGFQAQLEKDIAKAPDELKKAKQLLAELAAQRRSWAFANQSNAYLHETMQTVERELVAFADRSGSLVEVRRRLKWAKRIEAASTAHPKARVTWARAREAIASADGVVASKLYAARPVDLKPQMGLVPIGMNPKTRLWEFYHLRSAIDPRSGGDPADLEIPKHGADGSIAVGDETGIVFVLLPGGTFTMGAQSENPDAANHDPHARSDETPAEMTLESFFMGRHELTQGQWMRLSLQRNPSQYFQGSRVTHRTEVVARVTLAHPVESVNQIECRDLLEGHGLALPREVQWEYGCRGGTSTVWYPGDEVADLDGHANLLDQLATRVVKWSGDPVPFSDGHVLHAPVGSFESNAYGLHDVHGNILEWCDEVDRMGHGRERGGCYKNPAHQTRSARRDGVDPEFQGSQVGVRPVRAIR